MLHCVIRWNSLATLKQIFKTPLPEDNVPVGREDTLYQKNKVQKKEKLKVLIATASFLIVLNSSCKTTIFVQAKAHILFK